MTNPKTDFKPVAIVSMACRLPEADSPEAFWRLLHQGRCAWGKIPEARFDRELYYYPEKKGVLGKSYSDIAAVMDYSRVNPSVTGLSAEIVRNTDITHLAMCQTAIEALQAAGRTRDALRGKKVGVYVGHAAPSGLGKEISYGIHVPLLMAALEEVDDFAAMPPSARQDITRRVIRQVRDENPRRSRDFNPFLAAVAAATTIARALKLDGPARVYNSACASSLQAMNHAVRALQAGEVEGALVGGASCFSAETMVLFSASHSLSAWGSAPFTADADGLVVGEGNACVFLKRLEDAVRDCDPVLGVITGVGISSDGKGKSLWAPRKEGQVEAIRRAYESADPAKLQYMEGHATSTNLGDQTELQALTEVLKPVLDGRKIPIGSAKWNVGHTLEAAGIVGLAKLLLCLQNEIIPPAVEPGRALSTDVDWENVSLFPPKEDIPWKPFTGGQVRRGAVEAFGIGGLNTHVVVDGPEAKEVFIEDRRGKAYPAAVAPAAEKKPLEIAVIGMGTVMPESLSVEAYWENRRRGKSFLKPIPADRWITSLFTDSEDADYRFPMPLAGVVDSFAYDWKKHKIPPKQLRQASPLQFMILDAVDQAMRQSGYDHGKTLNRERTGCIVGSAFASDFSTYLVLGLRLPDTKKRLRPLLAQYGCSPEKIEEILDKFQAVTLERYPALVDETGSFTTSALASRVTKSFNLMGGGCAVDAVVDGSVSALESCVEMLQSGACDTMIYVGGQQNFSPESYLCQHLGGSLAKNGQEMRSPFDADADGVLPGEGCTAMILKRLDDARRDGDRVLGIIRGIGTSCAWGESDARDVERAIRRALENADTDAGNVRAVESAGLCNPAADAPEWEAVGQCYRHPAGEPIPFASAEMPFGSMSSGCAATGLMDILLALDAESMPGNTGLKTLNPLLENAGVRPSAEPVPLKTYQPQGRLMAGLNVRSTAGIVHHIIIERATPVTPQVQKKTEISMPANTTFVFYDATQRRIQKKREEAAGVKPPMPAEPEAVPETPAETGASISPEELQAFLVNFVVEQTGYPEEIVEMDVDLEADLGIDSIKKAQLFGELGEYFDIRPQEGRSLDEFPTLRSVMNFILERQGGSTAETAAKPAASPVTEAVPETPAETGASISPEELQAFLVNFVVEQTGYPEEIVEMDVDLEADLGIDSIKKAQLFGELGEYFDIRPQEGRSLDEFPTLRSVMNFILERQGQ